MAASAAAPAPLTPRQASLSVVCQKAPSRMNEMSDHSVICGFIVVIAVSNLPLIRTTDAVFSAQ